MAKRKSKNRNNRIIYTIVILCFLLIATIFALLPTTVTKYLSYGQDIPFTPEPPKSNLQLYTFNLPSVTPTSIPLYPTVPLVPPTSGPSQPPPESGCGIANPILQRGIENGKCCVQDGPVNNPSECCSGVPYCDLTKNPPVGSPGITCTCNGNNANAQQFCQSGPSPAPYWCNAKPVIYLYPKSKLMVDVAVSVPGTIPVSIPYYPVDGWKNVEAYPDGTLIYQGKKYSELFYESSVTPIDPPESGIVVSTDKLQETLKEITTRLGLKKNEQEEFLSYWTPRLATLDTPYIQVSVFDQPAKETIDHVDITPKPDTFIQFIMYFKGLQKPVDLTPILLPESVPAREGFTAVEWGGILDN